MLSEIISNEETKKVIVKPILPIFIGQAVLFHMAFSQCPQPGLKVIGADCTTPKNLAIVSVSCSSLNVKWKGNDNQAFILNVGYIKEASDSLIEIENSKTSCDNNGNCAVAISVQEGTTVKWDVQAICSANSNTLYSPKVDGPATEIPSCEFGSKLKSSNIHVYPNPASTYLIVVFSKMVTGNTEFKIFDMSGKEVYDKQGKDAIKTNNEYKLDLRNLNSGTYLIEIHHKAQIDQTKFVLIRP